MLNIFIVEDDKWYAEIMRHYLSLNIDYVVEHYYSGKDCLKNLHKNPDVVCIDYSLADMHGGELVKEIIRQRDDIHFVIVSGQKDVQVAIDLLREKNVEDYIVKDDNTNERLRKAVLRIQEQKALKTELTSLKQELQTKYGFSKSIKGSSASIREVFRLMQKACETTINVSITGETGTGKELVAKCIHYNSSRKNKNFVAVNVTAIPKELIESELFGYEKGAFTGAYSHRIGKFEEANGGTLFLDEIADMDLNMQSKLLRVLQEREVVRIGSNRIIELNVRIIVATHKNLAEEVRNGSFREDIYYRLLGLPIQLPSLRSRKEDIAPLVDFFSDEFFKENKKKRKEFSKEAIKKLLNYSFPGNIRELKAIVELAIVLSENSEVTENDIVFNQLFSVSDLVASECSLKEYNNKIIKYYLDKYNNDVALVAQKLEIGKSTLYKMMQKGVLE